MPDCRTAAAGIGFKSRVHWALNFAAFAFTARAVPWTQAFPTAAVSLCASLLCLMCWWSRLCALASSCAGARRSWAFTRVLSSSATRRFARALDSSAPDGSASRVRRWAGLDAFARNSGVSLTAGISLSRRGLSDCMEIYWGEGCQFYVTPVAAREVCVVLISRSPELRLEEARTGFPELQSRAWPMPRLSSRKRAPSPPQCGCAR